MRFRRPTGFALEYSDPRALNSPKPPRVQKEPVDSMRDGYLPCDDEVGDYFDNRRKYRPNGGRSF